MWNITNCNTKWLNKYFITFIDDLSKHTTIYLLKHKYEAFEKFKQYKTLIENQLIKKIKKFEGLMKVVFIYIW